jgi:hypothetical protein
MMVVAFEIDVVEKETFKGGYFGGQNDITHLVLAVTVTSRWATGHLD